ncbi:MAG: lipid A biosynthesis acyltransferase [Betaproteobacteria bacterium]|nr:lipid A biosynthesis acyltransferase [Betaproteobacteria bacterium]
MARIAIAAMWLAHHLPLAPLACVGVLLGSLLRLAGRERRMVCDTNLARCMPAMSAIERERLAENHFSMIGRAILERGLLWWASKERLTGMFEVAGIEHLQRLRGQAVILFTPHFLALDAGFTRLSCDFDLAAIYANQKSAPMNAMLLKGRTRFGRQRMFSRQQGVRAALSALCEGAPLYYLPDQDFGPRDAVFTPFFGVPAATITGLSRLAKLGGARVLPCVTRMLPGGLGYLLRIYPPLDNFPSGDDAADALRMNVFIEERVRECPEQYNWAHKRFKTRPPGEAPFYAEKQGAGKH